MKPFIALLSGILIAATSCAAETATLKDAFKDAFLIGAALNPAQFAGSNQAEAAIVKTQFNSISPENVLKWEKIHPLPGQYDFNLADKYVAFGVKHDMFVVGHTLVWHSQTPHWVFRSEGTNAMTRDALLQRMRDHIFTVVGRYQGKVKGWDVVNEALNENGTLRNSPWRRIIGDDFIEQAFRFAHEADPKAELYYNDYGLENEPKRNGALALVKKLKQAGVRIDGVGIQEHVSLTWPTNSQLDATLTAFEKLGVKTMVTELDVDVLPGPENGGNADIAWGMTASPALNPYTNGLPTEVQKALADRYAELFGIYLKHRGNLERVTFWGVTDGDSWLNNWPIPRRTAHPLLFDRAGKAKPAFEAVIKTAAGPKAQQARN